MSFGGNPNLVAGREPVRAMPITARRLRVLATRRVHFWTHDRGDCSNEVLGIVKIAIDARKTDVSDLIKFRQVTHYNVTPCEEVTSDSKFA